MPVFSIRNPYFIVVRCLAGRVSSSIQNILSNIPHAPNVRAALRGKVDGMNEPFSSFAISFTLSFMLSLATIIGMIPMALKLGTGGEQYAPKARAIIDGLTSPVILTVFIVPAAYLFIYWRKEMRTA